MKLAVIPARGGSKRIPRKNVRHFHGRPIISYSIDAALESGLFDRVIVSTDDNEIADTARAFGAEVPFTRPAELSDDHATTLDVIRHAVEWFDMSGEPVELVCCIYATAPFVRPADLQAGYDVMQADDVDYAFSVTTFPFPVQRALQRDASGRVRMFQPENERVRSQDLEDAWHDAGQFYWGQAAAYREKRSMMNGNSIGIPLPRERVQDIDTEEDWRLAELLFAALAQRDG